MAILPFSGMCFMPQRGYVYTIVVYFYAFRFAFSTILSRILHHFTLRLASKRTAFSIKTRCILHQNALRLAPKRGTFSNKWPKFWCKWRSP